MIYFLCIQVRHYPFCKFMGFFTFEITLHVLVSSSLPGRLRFYKWAAQSPSAARPQLTWRWKLESPDSHFTWQPNAPHRHTDSAPDPIRFSANLLWDAASATLTVRDQMLKHTCSCSLSRSGNLLIFIWKIKVIFYSVGAGGNSTNSFVYQLNKFVCSLKIQICLHISCNSDSSYITVHNI